MPYMLDLRLSPSSIGIIPIWIIILMLGSQTATALFMMPRLFVISTPMMSAMTFTMSALLNFSHPFHILLQFMNTGGLFPQEGHHLGK